VKSLSEILFRAGTVEISGNTSRKIRSVQFDSRRVKEDDVFVAVRGTQTDGITISALLLKKEPGPLYAKIYQRKPHLVSRM